MADYDDKLIRGKQLKHFSDVLGDKIAWTGTKAEYDALPAKDSYTIYFLNDTNEVYRGEKPYGGGIEFIDKDGTLTASGTIEFEIAFTDEQITKMKEKKLAIRVTVTVESKARVLMLNNFSVDETDSGYIMSALTYDKSLDHVYKFEFVKNTELGVYTACGRTIVEGINWHKRFDTSSASLESDHFKAELYDYYGFGTTASEKYEVLKSGNGSVLMKYEMGENETILIPFDSFAYCYFGRTAPKVIKGTGYGRMLVGVETDEFTEYEGIITYKTDETTGEMTNVYINAYPLTKAVPLEYVAATDTVRLKTGETLEITETQIEQMKRGVMTWRMTVENAPLATEQIIIANDFAWSSSERCVFHAITPDYKSGTWVDKYDFVVEKDATGAWNLTAKNVTSPSPVHGFEATVTWDSGAGTGTVTDPTGSVTSPDEIFYYIYMGKSSVLCTFDDTNKVKVTFQGFTTNGETPVEAMTRGYGVDYENISLKTYYDAFCIVYTDPATGNKSCQIKISKAGDYLPTGGGTMTGSIAMGDGAYLITTDSQRELKLCGGNDEGNGATITLGGTESLSDGGFSLITRDGSASAHELSMDKAGVLAVDSSRVVDQSFVDDNLDRSEEEAEPRHVLASHQGYLLDQKVKAISSLGRFVGLWECSTGLAKGVTATSTNPLVFMNGDYFIISAVSTASPAVNYMPPETEYKGVASTIVDPTTGIKVGDVYRYIVSPTTGDVSWSLLPLSSSTAEFATLGGAARDNTSLAGELDKALPKAGGTMTGTLFADLISGKDVGSTLSLRATESLTSGANLTLAGVNADTNPGGFTLEVTDGKTSAAKVQYLIGKPDGTLTWGAEEDGDPIITQTKGDARYLKLAGGKMTGDIVMTNENSTQICTDSSASMLRLRGGPDSNNGAYITLAGGTLTSGAGTFVMAASKTVGITHTVVELKGTPEGALTWGGKSILKEGDEISATKLGTKTVGSGNILMYLEKGVPTESDATVGGVAQPVYLKEGAITVLGDGTNTVGNANKPVYLAKDGKITAGNNYGGGTAVTLNGTSCAAKTASLYAPTAAGAAGQVVGWDTTNKKPAWNAKLNHMWEGTISTTEQTFTLPDISGYSFLLFRILGSGGEYSFCPVVVETVKTGIEHMLSDYKRYIVVKLTSVKSSKYTFTTVHCDGMTLTDVYAVY